jgi:error-prone DNA polymerase
MPYVELHCHSGFSFLDGASHPEELVLRAKELGYPALALTDHDGLYGSMEFAQAAKLAGIQPITGAEVTLRLLSGREPTPTTSRTSSPKARRIRQPLPAPHRVAHDVGAGLAPASPRLPPRRAPKGSSS